MDPDDDLFGGGDDDGGLLDDLAAAEHSAEALARPNLTAAAPPPGVFEAPAPPGLGVATAAAGVGAKLGGLGAASGRLALGCLFSAIAAIAGAAIWTFIAMKLEMEFGLLAWAIGGVTGFAMSQGNRGASGLAGTIAAGMSLLAVVGAKVAIFALVIYSVMTGNTDSLEFQRAFVTGHITQEIMIERGVTTQAEWNAQWEEVWDEASVRTEGMDEETVRERWQEYRDADAAAGEEASDVYLSLDSGYEDDGNSVASSDADYEYLEEGDADEGVLGFFFTSMFAPLDALFIFLAVATAFKVGSAGVSAE